MFGLVITSAADASAQILSIEALPGLTHESAGELIYRRTGIAGDFAQRLLVRDGEEYQAGVIYHLFARDIDGKTVRKAQAHVFVGMTPTATVELVERMAVRYTFLQPLGRRLRKDVEVAAGLAALKADLLRLQPKKVQAIARQLIAHRKEVERAAREALLAEINKGNTNA